MSLSASAKTDIKLEAVSVKWGREECRKVTFVTDVTGSLEGEYWDMNTVDNDGVETAYYIWLDNGSSTDPAIVDKTGIQVTYVNNDTGTAIAALFVTALGALAVNVSQSGAEVIYENSFMGAVTIEDFSNGALLTLETLSNGIGGNLGVTSQGGTTLNMEAQAVELKADQTGEVILGEVYTGSTVSADMSLIEMTKERWEAVVGSVTGDVYTPAAGTRLVGYGTSRLYQNLFDLGGKLVLHPIRLADADRSEDVVFWRSAPKPSTISYSGTDIQGMEVSFAAYIDNSKPEEISLFAQGDWQQDLS
jgi:hypothetical protein